jgi:ribosomal protein L11 methyltransferase
MRSVGELQIKEREEEDWANAWKEHFRPIRAGRRTVIAPPWHAYSPDSDSDLVVVLDPGMAFGTGTHPSTRLCLTALEDHLQAGDTVLDVGTGSGVLAITAVKLGASQVDAVDIEPVAVRSTLENAQRNGVADRLDVSLGSVDDAPQQAITYDVVVANIISRILVELASGLATATRPSGLLILSGVIEQHEPLVRDAFEGRGFRLVERDQIDDWVGLIYRAPI